MTLIETVVGLAILGTLIASLVVARSRALHQWAVAGRKQQAIAIADELLSRWWAQPTRIPVNGSGALADGMQWQTHLLDNPESKQLGIRIVELQVMGQPDDGTLIAKPLASVDFVLDQQAAASKSSQ